MESHEAGALPETGLKIYECPEGCDKECICGDQSG